MSFFEERQRPAVALIASGVVAVTLAAGWAMWLSARLDEVRWQLFVIPGFAALVLALTRMTTTVTLYHVRIAISPFPRKTIALAEVAQWEVVAYRPLLHYGGWGWRWSPSRGWAYTMRGNRGVMIHPQGRKPFLIGSRRPEELAAAIQTAKQARTSGA